MIKIKPIRRTGITLIEFMVVSALSTICMISVGVVVVNDQNAWNSTYNRAHESTMISSHLAKKHSNQLFARPPARSICSTLRAAGSRSITLLPIHLQRPTVMHGCTWITAAPSISITAL